VDGALDPAYSAPIFRTRRHNKAEPSAEKRSPVDTVEPSADADACRDPRVAQPQPQPRRRRPSCAKHLSQTRPTWSRPHGTDQRGTAQVHMHIEPRQHSTVNERDVPRFSTLHFLPAQLLAPSTIHSAPLFRTRHHNKAAPDAEKRSRVQKWSRVAAMPTPANARPQQGSPTVTQRHSRLTRALREAIPRHPPSPPRP